MTSISPVILATSVLFTGVTAFGAGYVLSPPPREIVDRPPIVDPDAWNKHGPGYVPSAQTVALSNSGAGSTIREAVPTAMTIADDTRAPAARADIGGFSLGDESPTMEASYTIEPLEGGTDSATGVSTIQVLSDAEAERAWSEAPHSGPSQPIVDATETPEPQS